MYKLENLNIPYQVSKAVDEIVTDAVDWVMQALLQARFSDLPGVGMEEILQQRTFEDKSYKAHEDHKKLYDALEKTPSGSPPPQPPPLHPPAGESGASGTSKALRSSQFPPSPPLSSIGTSGSAQQQGSKALSSSKSVASAPQSMAWTTSDTRYKSAGLFGTQELSPTDSLILDDSIPDEQVHFSEDKDFENDHIPTADLRKGWWRPLPAEERPATLEPAWTIPSSNVSDVENNWATALTVFTPVDLEGQAYEVVKAFYQDVVHLYKGISPTPSISKMKAASYLDFGLELLVPKHMWIDDVCTYDISEKYSISHWWFNRQKFYIDRHAFPSRRKKVRSTVQILSVIKIKAYSRYGYDYLSKIILRRADFQEHTIAEKDFKNLHPSDFEDLNLLLLSNYARARIELRTDVEMKDTIVVAMSKFVGEGTSNTPIVERIDKIERQIIDGKLKLVDDDGKSLPKVVSTTDMDSDSEVKDVVGDHVVIMTLTGLKRDVDSGYDTNSLLEQKRKTQRDDDYDP
nr:hypothetical protein [Tanacetum cinerariifolium]